MKAKNDMYRSRLKYGVRDFSRANSHAPKMRFNSKSIYYHRVNVISGLGCLWVGNLCLDDLISSDLVQMYFFSHGQLEKTGYKNGY